MTRPDGTYFSIPGHYGYGDDFDTLAEALAEAGNRIEGFRKQNAERGTLIPERSHVDERVKDASGDRPIRRYTVEAAVISRV